VRTVGPHFLIPPGDHDGRAAVLRGNDAHHLASVLRAAPGDPVSLADGSGVLLQARVREARPDLVRLAVVECGHLPAPRPVLTVVHALPKGRKLDEVVQRLTELGVERLVPVTSARSLVRLGDKTAKAVSRWRAVAAAAAKQSRRVRPLQVDDVGTWTTAFDDADAGVVLWEEARSPLRAVLAGLPADARRLVLAVGPEGGLGADEVARSGLPAASLGPTVLRTETAALVAASALLYHVGRLG
jgi:16S rRNA (uracil1498-N3)-methyltransferase